MGPPGPQKQLMWLFQLCCKLRWLSAPQLSPGATTSSLVRAWSHRDPLGCKVGKGKGHTGLQLQPGSALALQIYTLHLGKPQELAEHPAFGVGCPWTQFLLGHLLSVWLWQTLKPWKFPHLRNGKKNSSSSSGHGRCGKEKTSGVLFTSLARSKCSIKGSFIMASVKGPSHQKRDWQVESRNPLAGKYANNLRDVTTPCAYRGEGCCSGPSH